MAQRKIAKVYSFKPLLLLTIAVLFTGPAALATDAPRVIHAFVALADNQYQGIIPVPARIGRGDDPANNLYWGCDEALPCILRQAKGWQQVKREANPTSAVLERLIFWNAEHGAALIADAYRGQEIRQAITDFLIAAAGNHRQRLKVTLNRKDMELPTGGAADLVAYLGHDGLMDFQLAANPLFQGRSGKPAIVLCCKSEAYFSAPLARAGAYPLLLTTQLMYPGGFLLHAAAKGWLDGESCEVIRDRAARAYAANQGIGLKSARGVFTTGEREAMGSNH